MRILSGASRRYRLCILLSGALAHLFIAPSIDPASFHSAAAYGLAQLQLRTLTPDVSFLWSMHDLGAPRGLSLIIGLLSEGRYAELQLVVKLVLLCVGFAGLSKLGRRLELDGWSKGALYLFVICFTIHIWSFSVFPLQFALTPFLLLWLLKPTPTNCVKLSLLLVFWELIDASSIEPALLVWSFVFGTAFEALSRREALAARGLYLFLLIFTVVLYLIYPMSTTRIVREIFPDESFVTLLQQLPEWPLTDLRRDGPVIWQLASVAVAAFLIAPNISWRWITSFLVFFLYSLLSTRAHVEFAVLSGIVIALSLQVALRSHQTLLARMPLRVGAIVLALLLPPLCALSIESPLPRAQIEELQGVLTPGAEQQKTPLKLFAPIEYAGILHVWGRKTYADLPTLRSCAREDAEVHCWEIAQNYHKITRAVPDFIELLNAAGVGEVLYYRDSSLAQALLERYHWERIAQTKPTLVASHRGRPLDRSLVLLRRP